MLVGASLALAFRPTPRMLLNSAFFGGMGMYTYFVIRCNLLCLTSGESAVRRPRDASVVAGFFSGSATAFMFRPGLSPAQALGLTALGTALGFLSGLEEEAELEGVDQKPYY